MPVVPMKQKITVTPANGKELDEYNKPIKGQPFELKCRIQEGTKLIPFNISSNGIEGVSTREVMSTVTIYLHKLAPIHYSDRITYTNELGESFEYIPLNIEVKRSLSGKPLLTLVHV